MALRSLWNRICQFGCSCSACKTGTSPHQQGNRSYRIIKPRPFGTSTFLYTSIFGYATLLDGQRKSERREQWDEVLAEKRKEVEEAENAVVMRAKNVLESRFGPAGAEVESAWNQAFGPTTPIAAGFPAHNAANEDESTKSPPFEFREVYEQPLSRVDISNDALGGAGPNQQHGGYGGVDLEDTMGPSSLKEASRSTSPTTPEAFDLEHVQADVENAIATRESLTGERLEHYSQYYPGHNKPMPQLPSLSTVAKYSLPPQSLLADKRYQDLANKRWTGKKTYTIEICMARLVLDLCSVSGLLGQTPVQLESLPSALRPYASLSNAQAEELSRQLELEIYRLRSQAKEGRPARLDLGLPIPEYTRTFSPASEILIEKLGSICGQKTDLQRSDVARICSDILESPGRPNLHTINILLVAFTRSRQPALLKPLISLIHDGHIRPNEITDSSILRHYRKQNDSHAFLDYVSRMDGKNGALMLAHPRLKSLRHYEGSQGRCFLLGEKVIQAVSPSPLTYLEIIMGLLQFLGLRDTIRYCQHLQQKGWGFDFTCIYVLLFQSAVDSAFDLCKDLWAKAELLSDRGYKVPRNLYALIIAIYKIEKDKVSSDNLFKRYLRAYPEHGDQLLRNIKSRTRLINKFRSLSPANELSYAELEKEASLAQTIEYPDGKRRITTRHLGFSEASDTQVTPFTPYRRVVVHGIEKRSVSRPSNAVYTRSIYAMKVDSNSQHINS